MEPAYFGSYSLPFHLQLAPVNMMVTFDMRVPMCCTGCVHIIHEALLGLQGLCGLVIDLHNQQVIITGRHMDPLEALHRLRGFEAIFSRPCLVQQINRHGEGLLYGETCYTRTHCPMYRPGVSTETHHVSFNPRIATYLREE